MKFTVKVVAMAIVAGALLAGCKKSNDDASAQPYKADCNGSNQAPPNSSSATATFNGTYNSGTKTFSGTLSYSGITPTGWYIQRGTATTNGSIVVSLGAIVSSPFTFSVTLDAAAEAELKSGAYYINVQSAAYPSGEIRGKLVAR